MTLNKNRIIGIDYARAFFSVCVVAIHCGFFFILPSNIFNPEVYDRHTFELTDFITFYIFMLAVPVFFIISNYLFACKPYDWHDLGKRLFRYIKLFLFWSIIYNLLASGIILYPHNIIEAVILFLNGNKTIYWFFVSLGILTIIAHFSKRLSNLYLILLAVFSTFLVGILPIISIRYKFYSLTNNWNPLNFLPFPFIAIIIQRLKNHDVRSLFWNLLIMFLIVFTFLTAVLDWTIYVDKGFFQINLFAMPAYPRPSLILLSALVLVLVVNFQFKQLCIVTFMAKHSLALYCLHFFFLSIGFKIANIFETSDISHWLVSLITVTLLSYIVSIILPQILNKDLIR